jgi:hypothetical protein
MPSSGEVTSHLSMIELESLIGLQEPINNEIKVLKYSYELFGVIHVAKRFGFGFSPDCFQVFKLNISSLFSRQPP